MDEKNLIGSKKSFTFLLLKEHLPTAMVAYVTTVILAVTTLFLGLLSGPAIKTFLTVEDSVKTLTLDPATETILNLFGFEISGQNIDFLMSYLGFVILGLALIRFILQVFVFGSWEWIGEKISRKIRQELTKGFIYLNPTAKTSGEFSETEKSLTTIIANEVNTYKYYIVRFFGGIPRELIQSMFLLLALIIISTKLTLIFIFLLMPLAYLLSRIAKKIKKRSRHEFDSQNFLADWTQQRISGAETIKHYGSEIDETNRMRSFSNDLLKNQMKTAKTTARTAPMTEAISIIAVAIVFYYANRFKLELGVSSSSLMSYFACLAFLSQALNKLFKYTNISSRGKAALEKIWSTKEYLSNHTKNILSYKFKPSKENIAIELSNLSFKYKNSEANTLENLNLKFEYGKMYAISGPSGRGKSTLVNLMLGCLTPSDGELSVFQSLRKANKITYMPQILEGSYLQIGQILSYPELEYEPHKAKKALESANIWKSLEAKKIGVQNRLGFGDTNLSGGEWQRLNLARIFYHDSAIIITDESTSALDKENENEIIQELKELVKSGSCVINVAHRPSVIAASDINYEL